MNFEHREAAATEVIRRACKKLGVGVRFEVDDLVDEGTVIMSNSTTVYHLGRGVKRARKFSGAVYYASLLTVMVFSYFGFNLVPIFFQFLAAMILNIYCNVFLDPPSQDTVFKAVTRALHEAGFNAQISHDGTLRIIHE